MEVGRRCLHVFSATTVCVQAEQKGGWGHGWAGAKVGHWGTWGSQNLKLSFIIFFFYFESFRFWLPQVPQCPTLFLFGLFV